MSYCPCISRASLERGGWAVQRWSHIWDSLPSRAQLGVGVAWTGAPRDTQATQLQSLLARTHFTGQFLLDSTCQVLPSPFKNLTGSSVDIKSQVDSTRQLEKLQTIHLQKGTSCLYFSSIIYFLICEMGITALSHLLHKVIVLRCKSYRKARHQYRCHSYFYYYTSLRSIVSDNIKQQNTY